MAKTPTAPRKHATPPTIDPRVQRGELRYDCIGNLEPAPGVSAVPTDTDPEYVETRKAPNPPIALPDDT